MVTEKLLRIIDRLRDANTFVKQVYPSTWHEQMKIYRLMITDEMKSDPEILSAVLVLARRYSENDNTKMWIYATAVEMIQEG